MLCGTIRKHGQQAQTVRLRNAWVNVDPRNWTTRDDMIINVGLGSGGEAQQFVQIMAIADVQKQLAGSAMIATAHSHDAKIQQTNQKIG